MPQNKAPRFTNNELKVYEGATQGDIIAIGDEFVTDRGDTLTYSLLSEPSLFSVSVDGVITYEGLDPLDYETGPTSYTLLISVEDGVNEPVVEEVVILVLDVDESLPPPPAPTVVLDPATDSGDSDSDGITNVTTATLSGTALSGAKVTVSDSDGNEYTTIAKKNGDWSLDVETVEGGNEFTAIVEDEFGTESEPVVVNFTVDLSIEIPTINLDNDSGNPDDNVTSNSSLELSGTGEPGRTVEVTDGRKVYGAALADAEGNWTITTDALRDGLYELQAVVVDEAGNVGTSSIIAITIDTSNTAPTANDDYATTDEDTPITFAPGAGLVNDTDPDGDTLTATNAYNPVNGSLDINFETGEVTFIPDANFVGTGSFDYDISDGNGGTDTATVYIDVQAVNDAPVAVDDFAETFEDTAITFGPGEGLLNDYDVDGDVITPTGIGIIENGSLTFNGDGSLTFTPALDFTGTASFEYIISDGNGESDTGTVYINVLEADDVLVGDSGDNLLDGGVGDDNLSGLAGNDILIGGSGDDIMSGGLDSDTFVFQYGDTGWDFIHDFTAEDKLDLSGLLSADGVTEDAVSLDDVLDFQLVGSNTEIYVDLGNDGSYEQIIQLSGVDITANNMLTDQQIINNLLGNNGGNDQLDV